MTNAPTIQQIQNSVPQGLWEFLSQLPASFEAQLFYGLVGIGVIGMLANFVKKWARGEISGGLIHYLFVDNVRGTWLSIIGQVSFAAGYIGSGIFMSNGEFVGWKIVLILGFQNGFLSDVVANKSTPPPREVWPKYETARTEPAPLPITTLKGDL